jgi:hypothetical protein
MSRCAKIYFDRHSSIMIDTGGVAPSGPPESMTLSPPRTAPPAAPSPESGDPVEAEILRAVRSLRFGSVEVVVHEGNVVQIVRTERLRPGAAGGPGGRKV